MASEVLVSSVADRSYVFGERALISLFRGAGSLLGSSSGSGPSGIDTLREQLQTTFPDYFWTARVFDSYEGNVFSFREIGSSQALAFVNQFDRVAALGTVGYSAGGLSAIRLASGLSPATVNLLVQIDSYVPLTGTSGEDKVLPSNVARGINYYQVANRFNPFRPGFDPLDLQGATWVQGSENINVESLFGDRRITHRTIVNDPRVQNQILQDIERNVLQDLKFDRQGQLNLTGGAQLRNNILSLAPGGDGMAGGAFIAEDFAIAPDFSFQTRFEFRLPSASTGFSFWLQPIGRPLPQQEVSSLAVTFEPFTLQSGSTGLGSISLLTPSFSEMPLVQANAGLNLASSTPLTAWINYDGNADQISVFLADTLTQPSTPLLSYGLSLPDILGNRAWVGFQTTTQVGEGQAELLTWDFAATSGVEVAPIPDIVDQKRLPLDYNGDSKADLLFRRTTTGIGDEYGIWLMDGSAPLTQASIGTAGEGWQYVSSADVNGDSEADLIFAQVDQGLAGSWLMDGTTTLAQGLIGTYNSLDPPRGWLPPFTATATV